MNQPVAKKKEKKPVVATVPLNSDPELCFGDNEELDEWRKSSLA
jgi:hypothetical protein